MGKATSPLPPSGRYSQTDSLHIYLGEGRAKYPVATSMVTRRIAPDRAKPRRAHGGRGSSYTPGMLVAAARESVGLSRASRSYATGAVPVRDSPVSTARCRRRKCGPCHTTHDPHMVPQRGAQPLQEEPRGVLEVAHAPPRFPSSPSPIVERMSSPGLQSLPSRWC